VIDGALLAVIAERAGVGAAVLERLGGPLGAAARQSAGELAALPAGPRAQRVALELARVGSPVPPTVRAVHGSWVEAALAAEPEAKAALERPSLDEATAWLLRRAFGALPRHAPSPTAIEGAQQRLRWAGALALGSLLGGRRQAIAAALAQLGDGGQALREVVRGLEAGELSAMELREATRACRGVELRQAYALERIGVTALGDAIIDGRERERWMALCCFLPRPVGLAIAAQL
jgi:hypothetical protein